MPKTTYNVSIRARSLDGSSHNFGEHIVINDETIKILNQKISSETYQNYWVFRKIVENHQMSVTG